MHDFLACTYSSVCSGCDLLLRPANEQKELKLSDLRAAWTRAVKTINSTVELPDPRWISIDKGGLRDRVDLMVDARSGDSRLGLFDRFRTGIVDLQGCPQLSPALEDWLRDFRRIRIPTQRGSIRLRVAPDGRRGVWLDLANTDVKALLDERTTLDRLREGAIVEIGQRRKRLVEREGRLRLDDPVLEPWFETYCDDDGSNVRSVPLHCTIGTFTQPGFRANRALVSLVLEELRARRPKRCAEFGAGIGNFTLPLASVAGEVEAYEIDKLALEGLSKSLLAQGWADKVKIRSGNFQAGRGDVDLAGRDLVLVDPPRSGLMNFLNPLEEANPDSRPKCFLYVSCFADSFAEDSAKLAQMGYAIEKVSVVDQFPQSRHYEIVATFTR